VQGHLYRYPHPEDETRFIYVGQGAKRDKHHRRGISSFGRRFKKRFPDLELPQPIREVVEVANHLELNELEIVAMFQFRTWYGYEGGMNLQCPGSIDYKNFAKLSGIASAASGRIQAIGRKNQEYGRVQGRVNAENGHMANIQKVGCVLGGLKQGAIRGRQSVESGHLARIRELPQTKAAQSAQGRRNVENGQLARIRAAAAEARRNSLKYKESRLRTGQGLIALRGLGNHVNHHINKRRTSPRCAFCSEQNLVIAWG